MAYVKNYPSFNLRKEGVQVEILEQLGDLKPYGELQEVWVQLNGIPPKWCHWRVFAQIASGFGLMTEVDWSTLFKTFYETVRVKVACKDFIKIPRQRLLEMNKKLHIVEFTMEGDNEVGKGNQGKGDDDGGDGGGDDGHGGVDEEADDLYDINTERPLSEDPPPSNNSNMKTPTNKPSGSSGYKTVSRCEDLADQMNQEQQLKEFMEGASIELLTDGMELDVALQDGTDAIQIPGSPTFLVVQLKKTRVYCRSLNSLLQVYRLR